MLFPKMKEHAPKRAHHNLSHYFRTSMAPGALYPIYVKNVVPGDDLQLDYESLVNTQAALSPLYGTYKLQIDTFFAGTSLYVPKLWRNGTMTAPPNSTAAVPNTLDVSYPYFNLIPGSNTAPAPKIDPSHLQAYLGMAPFAGAWWSSQAEASVPASTKNFNAIPLLMYLDIYRHYYASRTAGIGVYLNPALQPQDDLSLANLDNLFLNLPADGGNITTLFNNPAYLPGPYRNQLVDFVGQPLGGMLYRTFLPDRMNVILNPAFYANNVTSVQVSTVGNTFQIDQLVTAKKLWNSRNKDSMTSGTFRDWVRSHYGVTPHIMDDMPTFLGSSGSDVVFEDIRATTTNEIGSSEIQYLGDKASSGKGYVRSRRHRVVADRPGYVMVIASLVPRVDYYQDEDRYIHHGKLSDEFRPEFNGIGLQDVLVSDLNASWQGYTQNASAYNAATDPTKQAKGKTIAWVDYQTAINRIRGTFCTTERSWVLSRDMRDEIVPAATNGPVARTLSFAKIPYVTPGSFNTPFAIQDATAQNFLVQFYIKANLRSTVLKRLRPKF